MMKTPFFLSLFLLYPPALSKLHTIYSNLPNGDPRIPNAPFGQHCNAPAQTTKCLPGATNSAYGADVLCQHGYDCCFCGHILCAEGCGGLICNGDASCFGVKNISLKGGNIGTDLICNGDLSCQGTYVHGINVTEVYCTGHASCAYSRFDIECLVAVGVGCEIQCDGVNSCEGDPADDRKEAVFVIDHSHGLTCGVESCRWSNFVLATDTGGTVDCGGNSGCEGSDIFIRGANSIICGGIASCRHAHIVVVDPVAEEFSITCSGLYSCHGLDIEVIVTDPATTFMEGITCVSANSCERMKIAVVQQGAAIATGFAITSLECAQSGSCTELRVDLGQGVVVEECQCAAGACDGLLGVTVCEGLM